jgi:hypothetical protein
MKIRRWTARVLVACLVATGTVVGVTSPAHAAVWQLTDSFEGDPASRWSCWHTVDDWFNGCSFVINHADWPAAIRPRTGANRGSLSGGTGWSDMGRSVRLSPFQAGRTLHCAAGIYIKHHAGNGNTVTAQLEVIDAATWTYVSIKPFTSVSATVNPWRLIGTDTWIPARRDVFVRIGILGDNGTGVDTLQLDDMVVQCQYL